MDPSNLPSDLPSLLPDTEDLRSPAPTVYGPVEYRTWRRRLERLDEILRQGQTEELFVRLALRRRLAECRSEFEAGRRPMARLGPGEQLQFQRLAARALRLTVARTICGGSYRSFTARLADSSLLQWFCLLERVGWEIRIPGKSQLQRYQGMVGESELREVMEGLLDEAEEEDSALELAAPVELGTQFLDSTCVKLNIHYPTDWVLLRDATRTLMKATILIRRRGLKVRMREPREFLRAMNGLAMEMAKQARRAVGAGVVAGAAAGCLAVCLAMAFTRISWSWYCGIGTVVTVATGYLVSLCLAVRPSAAAVGCRESN